MDLQYVDNAFLYGFLWFWFVLVGSMMLIDALADIILVLFRIFTPPSKRYDRS